MKNELKKFLSLFMALMMFVSIIPAFEMDAFAKSSKVTFPNGWRDWEWHNHKVYSNITGDYLGSVKHCTKKGIMRIPKALVSEFHIEDEDNLLKGEKYDWFKLSKTLELKPAKLKAVQIRSYDGKHALVYLKNYGSNMYNCIDLEMEACPKSVTSITTNAKIYASSNVVTVSTVGTMDNGSKVTIPKGTNLNVTSVSSDGKKGLVKYGGKNVWINLSYLNYVAPAITKPPAPSVSLKTSTDINIGGQMTIEWNSVTDAKYYTAAMYDSGGNQVKSYSNIYGNSATFMTETPGTYSFKVTGHNSNYTGDTGECSQRVTVHGEGAL